MEPTINVILRKSQYLNVNLFPNQTKYVSVTIVLKKIIKPAFSTQACIFFIA